MVNLLNLYLDDSGTRHPDRKPGRQAKHGYDWFALGGVAVLAEQEDEARQQHADFCQKWQISAPLRSADIRAKSGPFHWLVGLSKPKQDEFYEDLYQTMARSPVIGIGCVIDRPGYNARYAEKYEGSRWMLCRTAFAVVVERAAKYAARLGRKMDVNVERGDEHADEMIKEYYNDLKISGMPFAPNTSQKYQPLNAKQFGETLYDLKFKRKSSPMEQFADLFLWPICMGGYNKGNRPYSRLMEDKKLIDSVLPPEEIPHLGIKYSCWEKVERKAKNTKAQSDPGFRQPPAKIG